MTERRLGRAAMLGASSPPSARSSPEARGPSSSSGSRNRTSSITSIPSRSSRTPSSARRFLRRVRLHRLGVPRRVLSARRPAGTRQSRAHVLVQERRHLEGARRGARRCHDRRRERGSQRRRHRAGALRAVQRPTGDGRVRVRRGGRHGHRGSGPLEQLNGETGIPVIDAELFGAFFLLGVLFNVVATGVTVGTRAWQKGKSVS